MKKILSYSLIAVAAIFLCAGNLHADFNKLRNDFNAAIKRGDWKRASAAIKALQPDKARQERLKSWKGELKLHQAIQNKNLVAAQQAIKNLEKTLRKGTRIRRETLERLQVELDKSNLIPAPPKKTWRQWMRREKPLPAIPAPVIKTPPTPPPSRKTTAKK